MTFEEFSDKYEEYLLKLTSKKDFPRWFDIQLKTQGSRNITIDTWNRVITLLGYVASDDHASTELLDDIVKVLNTLKEQLSDKLDVKHFTSSDAGKFVAIGPDGSFVAVYPPSGGGGSSGGGGIVVETDPTVPAWAKQPNKPTYTASEVGALSARPFTFNDAGKTVVVDVNGMLSTASPQYLKFKHHINIKGTFDFGSSEINVLIFSNSDTVIATQEYLSDALSNAGVVPATGWFTYEMSSGDVYAISINASAVLTVFWRNASGEFYNTISRNGYSVTDTREELSLLKIAQTADDITGSDENLVSQAALKALEEKLANSSGGSSNNSTNSVQIQSFYGDGYPTMTGTSAQFIFGGEGSSCNGISEPSNLVVNFAQNTAGYTLFCAGDNDLKNEFHYMMINDDGSLYINVYGRTIATINVDHSSRIITITLSRTVSTAV